MSKARVVTVTSGAATVLRRGHRWIGRAGVAGGGEGPATGEVVEIRDSGGEPLGQGIWDDASPIAARVYARSPSPKLTAEAVVRGIERAMARRRDLTASPATTAYRLCNGEGDRVPGVVVDRYDTVAVVRLDGAAIATWLPRLANPLRELLESSGVRSDAHRATERGATAKLEPLLGPPPPAALEVRQNGGMM